ncbi:DEAD/DEAH box helicase family protein, partial [Gulbenkiania mobilis]|uniref:primosomal protein N' family DNA-binding protein n=1 Tax=Gulbenkiania mobilis TaxID=397457 RepID=UPI000A567829
MANDVYLQVAVDVPLRETFTYCCERPLPTGTRVAVPFGPRRACGIVTGPSAPGGLDPARIRPVLEIFDELPPLPVSFLEMVAFAAAYYHHPYGQTLFTALPTALRQPGNVRLPDRRHWWLTPAGRETPPPAAHRARRAVWQALAEEACTLAALRPLAPQASAILKAWLAEGRVASGEPAALSFREGPVLALNGEQQAVLQALAGALAQGFSAWLLHGITGSGKTEVYLQLMARVLAAGQQVLVLIPEINLTPQLIERFAARFPDTPLVTLHSGLSDGGRLAGWVD